MSDKLALYQADWMRVLADVGLGAVAISRAIELADLNGLFDCNRHGEWPDGMYMVSDDRDVYPTSTDVAMFKATAGRRRKAQTTHGRGQSQVRSHAGGRGFHGLEWRAPVTPAEYEWNCELIETELDGIMRDHPIKIDQIKQKPHMVGWVIGQIHKNLGGKGSPKMVCDIVCERLWPVSRS